MKLVLTLLTTTSFLLVDTSFAQDTDAETDIAQDVVFKTEQNIESAQRFRQDLSTPSSPGFTVIGASPTNIARPGNLQELVVDTASFVENGTIRPGLAINFQPFWLFNQTLSLESYSGFSRDDHSVDSGLNSWQRVVARTQVSLATVEGENADSSEGARFGFGVQTELIDGRDPRSIEYAKCQIKAFEKLGGLAGLDVLIDVVPADADTTDEEFRQSLEKSIEKSYKTPEYDQAEALCRENAADRIAKSPSWMIGAGLAASTADSSFDNLDFSGASFWTTYTKPFGENKFVTLFGQADLDQTMSFNGVTGSTDNYRGAISFGFEEPQSWRLEATASYHIQNANVGTLNDEYFQYSVDGAFKLRDGLWLEGSFGARTGSSTQDETFSQIQLKVDLSEPGSNFLKE